MYSEQDCGIKSPCTVGSVVVVGLLSMCTKGRSEIIMATADFIKKRFWRSKMVSVATLRKVRSWTQLPLPVMLLLPSNF